MNFLRESFLGAALAISGSVGAEQDATYALSNGQTFAPLERFRECDVCPEMIVMPMGSFMMGAIEGESRNPFDAYREGGSLRRRGPDEINIIPFEHPRHPVEMDIPYAMARNEITRREWMICVEKGGCTYVPDHTNFSIHGLKTMGPEHPVFNVSYLDIQEYLAWLNAQVGVEVYRLPTEAEWEYAARAGTTTRFAQGDELTTEQANFLRRATEFLRQQKFPQFTNLDVPVPVEELDAANDWGLRHMSGNVAELTMSCFSPQHLGLPSAYAYLLHAQSQESCRRVAKGGAFNNAMDRLRLATRTRPTETRRRDFRGFRVVRQLGVSGK